MKVYQILLLVFSFLYLSSPAYSAKVCIGCTQDTDGQTGSQYHVDLNVPRSYVVSGSAPADCPSEFLYCVVVRASNKTVTLYQNGSGVKRWDAVVRPTSRVYAGPLNEIVWRPQWCPTESLRKKYGLPAGCIAYGDNRNAMGEAKWIMGGNFPSTYRIHGTAGFGADWRSEITAGCARLLNDGIVEISSRVSEGNTWVVFRP